MVQADHGNIKLDGSFHQILAEITTLVNAAQKELTSKPELQKAFKGDSIIGIITKTLDIQKGLEESGLTPEEYVQRHLK